MEQQTITTNLEDRLLGDLAAQIPGATRVFREHRLDFCCHGDRPLRLAAQQQGVDLQAVVEQLVATNTGVEPDEAMTTDALIGHILERYHAMHREELPELIHLARKVEDVHQNHPEAPRGLATTLEAGFARLDAHMQHEETALFPQMQEASNAVPAPLLEQLRHEHGSHGEFLAELESLTNGFRPPEGACRTWKALYAGTRRFVNDVMEHVHLENNVLFRRLSV